MWQSNEGNLRGRLAFPMAGGIGMWRMHKTKIISYFGILRGWGDPFLNHPIINALISITTDISFSLSKCPDDDNHCAIEEMTAVMIVAFRQILYKYSIY